MKMLFKEEYVEIINELGLHARAAANFVKEANKFKSDIMVQRDDSKVNGKSIMGIMMLAAPKGATIKIEATGEDAEEALQAIIALINNKFGEEK